MTLKPVNPTDADHSFDEERLIVSVDWTPDSTRLLAQVQDRIQHPCPFFHATL